MIKMALNSLFSCYFEPSFYDNTFCPLCFTISFDRLILSVLSCSVVHATYHLRVSLGNAIAGVSKVGHLLRAPLSSGVERGLVEWRSPKDAMKEKLVQSVVRPGTSLKKGSTPRD